MYPSLNFLFFPSNWLIVECQVEPRSFPFSLFFLNLPKFFFFYLFYYYYFFPSCRAISDNLLQKSNKLKSPFFRIHHRPPVHPLFPPFFFKSIPRWLIFFVLSIRQNYISPFLFSFYSTDIQSPHFFPT